MGGHPAPAGQRAGVVLRRGMPFARVHFDGDAEFWPPGVGPGHEGIGRADRGVEQRQGQAGLDQQVLQVSLRGRPDAIRDVGLGLAERDRADVRPGLELLVQPHDLAAPALHGVGDNRPHVPQAVQVAGGIGDGPCGQGIPQRPEAPDPLRQPGSAMEPDELRVAPPARGGHQDIDLLGGRPADAVMAQGCRTGDHAGRAGVQQRGHFLLDLGGRPSRGDVNTGQQALPRAADAQAILQSMPGQGGGERLPAANHVELAI